jgi:phospho-N-acetylmuramoyl-pentapeptide-transferase
VSANLSSTTLKQPTGLTLLLLLAALLILLAFTFQGQINLVLIWPLLLSALLTGGSGYAVLPLLRNLKAGQIIREDGPQAHLKKAGTPTMGGIFFVPVAVILGLVWTEFNTEVLAVSLLTLAYMGIGWIDDWQILVKKSNKGISPKTKLILQIACAVLFCAWMLWTQPQSMGNIQLPAKIILPLGPLFWLLAGFVLVAESNATNLTDGVDGLAGGTCALAFLGLGIITAPDNPDLGIFCACLAGGCLGFVIHNHNPAKVFMGDTGSLALGGGLAAVGLLSGNLWGLFVVSLIFFVESLSVIAQVSYYKATKGPDGKGKRLFKMAPMHHHLELSGWAETQIVGAFYLINAFLALLAIFTVVFM